MPKTKLPWAVVVSTMPLVSDRTPTPRVCRVVTMSMRSCRLRPSRSIFQMIRVSPRRRSARQAFHCGRSFGPGGGVGVGFQAVRDAQGVELQLGVLVGGGNPGISDSVAHGHTHYRNSCPC